MSTKSEFLADLVGYDPRPEQLFTHKDIRQRYKKTRTSEDQAILESLANLECAKRAAKMAELFTSQHEINEVSPTDLIGPPEFAHLQVLRIDHFSKFLENCGS